MPVLTEQADVVLMVVVSELVFFAVDADDDAPNLQNSNPVQ